MESKILFAVIFAMVFFVLSSVALAAISNLVSVQGRLTNQNVQLQNGTFAMVFRLYTAETGGSAIYTEQLNVNATNGIFEAYLGSNTSLAGTPFDQQYYMSIQVGSDAEMTPRIRVGSSGYSFRSNITEFLNTTTVAEGRLNFSASGNITFGADTNLYRSIANVLATDDDINLTAGRLYFTADTNLYRSAANTLRTDDALVVGNSITPATDNSGALGSVNNRWPQLFLDTVAGVSLWNQAGDSNPLSRLTGIDLNFGSGGSSAPDTNLRRLRVNVLTTDDNMTIAGNLTVNLGLNLTDVPVITFGTTGDTNLYRAAANNLATDDNFNITGFLNATGSAYLYRLGIGTSTPLGSLQVLGGGFNSLFVNSTTGNIGINTTTPNASLEIANGGLRLNATVSKPSCSSLNRGLLWFEKNETSGGDDMLFSCMKNSSASFTWVIVARGG